MLDHSKRMSEQLIERSFDQTADCSLWSTLHRLPEDRSKEPTDEPTETASSVSAGLEISDCSLWRTQTADIEATNTSNLSADETNSVANKKPSKSNTTIAAESEKNDGEREETNIDGSEQIPPQSEQHGSPAPVRLSELTESSLSAAGSSRLELTDCSLWRTRVGRSDLQLEEGNDQPTASSRLDFFDDSHRWTDAGATKSEAEKPPLHPTTKLVDFSTSEAEEPKVPSLPPSVPSLPPSAGWRPPFVGLPPLPEDARLEAGEWALSVLQPIAEESPTPAPAFVGLYSPVDVTMRTADSTATPRHSFSASTPGSSTMGLRQTRARMPLEFDEVSTQTSADEAQLPAVRPIGNPLTQNFRPLSPRRRAALQQPPRVAAVRPSRLQPYFRSASSDDEQSSGQSAESPSHSPPRSPVAEASVVQPLAALLDDLRIDDDRSALETPSFGSSRPRRPNIVGSGDENPNPTLRRSTRIRPSRPCNPLFGERLLYERDADGNLHLVGVQEGRTADPLCIKWGTFDKQKALQMERDADQRRRPAKPRKTRK
ncbi:hypothetical protein M3Y99_00260100 [Aphelenchoides fujianensis]|nr:hypothetical protein M3Y99_00260100 [Aphelenchoides fujianensis]